MKSKVFCLVTTAFMATVFLLSSPANADPVLGQVDAFDDGTAQGWREGGQSPNPPTYDAGLGPDGMVGHLMNVSGGGGGPGSKWLMFNFDTRWTGDYFGAGVDRIDLAADNRSGNGQEVNLRIALFGAGGWFVSDAIALSDGSGWTDLSYELGSLSYVAGSGGTTSLADTLTGVNTFEILSAENSPPLANQGVLVEGDAIAADVRIDNIRAVPEPGSIAFVALAGMALLSRRRR